MAQLTRIIMPNIGADYTGATAGTSPAWAAMAAGDLFPVGSGQGTLLGFRTAGTAITATLVSVVPERYGDNKSVTVVLAATDEQWIFIDSDGFNRFDQGPGANLGFISVTYSVLTAGTRAGVTIQ